MVTVQEVLDKKGLRAFVKFPFSIYKDSPNWVPPMINQELESFTRKKNPIFQHAEARFFLAYKNGRIIGRIAAIINWNEVNEEGIKKMRFGWFDFIDDTEVSRALIGVVEKIGKEHQLSFCEGPIGFSNLDKVGVLTEGFDRMGTMVSWYNHPYYLHHYQTLGYKIEKKYVEGEFDFKDVNPEVFSRPAQLIKKRYGFKAMNFTKTRDIMAYADKMFDLFNITYAHLASFVAIPDAQRAYIKKKFLGFINPEYIKFVMDPEDNIIAFALVMPSFAEAIKKAKGKLFPLGFWHLLKAKKHSKTVVFYLIGILPEYQNKGVTAIIFEEFYKVFQEKGIEHCIRTAELEENTAIHQIWKHFNAKITKRRVTFRKDL